MHAIQSAPSSRAHESALTVHVNDAMVLVSNKILVSKNSLLLHCIPLLSVASSEPSHFQSKTYTYNSHDEPSHYHN